MCVYIYIYIYYVYMCVFRTVYTLVSTRLSVNELIEMFSLT